MRYDKWRDPGDLKSARERVLSGWGSREGPLPADIGLMQRASFGNRVLDLGCGVGRNLKELAARADEVVGYDFEGMLSLVEEGLGSIPSNVVLESNWEAVRTMTFDSVLVSLVLQHLEHHDLDSILTDLSRMTSRLYIHTRSANDFGDTVFNLIAANGCWKIAYVHEWFKVQCVEDLDKLGPDEHCSMELSLLS